jgi:hypothetical protein
MLCRISYFQIIYSVKTEINISRDTGYQSTGRGRSSWYFFNFHLSYFSCSLYSRICCCDKFCGICQYRREGRKKCCMLYYIKGSSSWIVSSVQDIRTYLISSCIASLYEPCSSLSSTSSCIKRVCKTIYIVKAECKLKCLLRGVWNMGQFLTYM